MNSKSNGLAKMFNMLAFVSLGVVVIVMLAVFGSNAFSIVGRTFAYAYNFLAVRAWDTKKIIGIVILAVAVIVWLAWCIFGQIKTKGKASLIRPLFVLFVPFAILVIYRYRASIEVLLKDSERLLGLVILLCFIVLSIVFGLLSIIFGVSADVHEARALSEEKDFDDEDTCDCRNNKAYVELEEEVVILRRDVDDLQEQVKALSDSRSKRSLDSAVVQPEKKEPVVDDIPPVVVADVASDEPVAVVATKKVVRRPFADKMANAAQETKDNYDIIKNELISYGVKSRLSNGGDTFRLRRETYAMITLVGKNLKIYLALNPANYENTTIPAKDESGKKRYAATPTMLRIKSKLSVKRAKMLIADLMKAHELNQKEVQQVKYSDQVKARKARKAITK